MAAKNEPSDNQRQFSCQHCHQAVGQEVAICPNCNRSLTGSRTWPPLVPPPYLPSGTGHVASKPHNFSSILSGVGIGIWAYVILLIALWVGEGELSKRYMPPYPGSVGIIIWIMTLTLPLLPVWLFANWCRALEANMLLGVKLGAIFGLLVAMVLLFLLLHNTDWRQDLGY